VNFTISKTKIRSGDPPPRVVKVKNFLDSLPDGELLIYDELENRIKISRSTLIITKKHPLLIGYWVMALVDEHHVCLFANPKTIAAYTKEFLA